MSEDTIPSDAQVSILLVDDEVRNLEVLESVLPTSEYRLVRALTANSALMQLLEGEFAAIILDVRMPDMSGLELANLIKKRKRTQHIPIIFLTAYYQEDKHVLEGYDTGAVDYLTKPINPQILKSKIAVFVDLYRKTRALAASNRALELEVFQRQEAEEALRRANNDLEARVQVRTADLLRVNEALRTHEAQLRLVTDRAVAASRAKDDFLARLSHELRTPLNPVLLLASDAADNTELPDAVRADFEMIARNVTLEARLIDDLLDLTSITHGKVPLDLRPFDVHAILHDALAMVSADAAQKKVTVALDLKAGRRTILCDDMRLKQVFWNVLKNAVKFTPEGGRIVVETATNDKDGRLTIRVADTGIGMTPEEIGRIFETFSQGDHANEPNSHRFGGLGLGLAISRMLVERQSGTIHATSAGRNQGTTFAIEFPLVEGHERSEGAPPRAVPPEQAPPQAAPREGVAARHILLVEDHAPTRRALAQLLVRRGYEVESAGSVAEARAIAGSKAFELLISDIGLPDGSGHDLMAELRGRNGLVGIALTGYGMDDDVDRSHAAGFAAHLTKPVNVKALDRVLAAVQRKAAHKGA